VAYEHTNSRGESYFLHGKEVVLRNGRKQRIFYFSRSQKDAEGIDTVPTGYMVGENSRTGLPYLTKAK
jgi:hypothetical protein